MAQIQAKPFKLALLQLSSLNTSKANNIAVARAAIQQALKSTSPPPDLIVLPEIWNSPYAVAKFREYAEKVPEVGSTGDQSEGEGETVKAMREMAKEAGVWLIGGEILGT
jgi:predicted amidohydrolase